MKPCTIALTTASVPLQKWSINTYFCFSPPRARAHTHKLAVIVVYK